MSIAAAAADFQALGVFRVDDGIRAAGNAASLPNPDDDDHALVGEELAELLTNRGLFQAAPCL